MTSQELVLETNDRIEDADVTELYSLAEALPLLGPVVNSTCWLFRVRLSRRQAIIAQVMRDTVRIGFEQPDVYKTVPYDVRAEELFFEIKKSLSDLVDPSVCIAAIQMIQQAVQNNFESLATN